jgi:hypothetical protein
MNLERRLIAVVVRPVAFAIGTPSVLRNGVSRSGRRQRRLDACGRCRWQRGIPRRIGSVGMRRKRLLDAAPNAALLKPVVGDDPAYE